MPPQRQVDRILVHPGFRNKFPANGAPPGDDIMYEAYTFDAALIHLGEGLDRRPGPPPGRPPPPAVVPADKMKYNFVSTIAFSGSPIL